MPDHAVSSDPAVQVQLDRLRVLSPGADILGLGRITALLARVGNPQERLPPVLHVAGTNGKGSTCAFLRTALEAAGYRAHVYSSPHLVRFNERIRLAGELIDDAALAPLLAEVLDAGGDIGASFFEVTTAAAFLAFARIPADACIIEVGLGGRLDATNVIARPLITGIAQLGIDHQSFLGDKIEAIAAEKAGIAKPGVPLVTMRYPATVAAITAKVAHDRGALLADEEVRWRWSAGDDALIYEDGNGAIKTPLPALAGAHQAANLALAIAMLRHQRRLIIPAMAYRTAASSARWPARMQRLGNGALTRRVAHASVWLDGAHNAAAAEAIAASLATLGSNRSNEGWSLIVGMLANKDAAGLLSPIAACIDRLIAVPIPGHEHHSPGQIAAIARSLGVVADTAPDVAAGLDMLAGPVPRNILILGSLYLAGHVLAANGELPV
ncbi:bifunctional folylpolyglutamate synthase/dihydrofolate synthase [uncultured Sphingomonas sp.]|uniref:bifunctional folylpolyglutamate synthase/dihydrofolate synthase n=1 Tax=uncultured Sphingomonas sp. TaxID=158754 RepID=UPI0035CC08DE